MTMQAPRKTRIGFALAAALLAAALVPAALAGKGGNGGGKTSASMSLVLLDGATQPQHGGRVTFEVSTTATDRPFVGLKCWQGSIGVYNNSIGIFPTYLFDPWLTLDSVYWMPGVDASCTATAYYYDKRGRQHQLAVMSFGVAP